MEDLILTFLPYSHRYKSERREGLTIPAADMCGRCDRQCEGRYSAELSLCSYGVNYVWFDRNLLIFGLVVSDYSDYSAARKKVLRRNKGKTINTSQLEAVRTKYLHTLSLINTDIEMRKQEIIDEYKAREKYKLDFLTQLRPDLEKSFSYFHDYRQFIARMQQNINVILESRYQGGDLQSKLSRAMQPEKAIYWASQLMDEKLRTAYFLLHPEEIVDRKKYTAFRFHGLVTKYLRIYESSFKEKDISVEATGESVGNILGPSAAVAVIPHTFIDNALKYSPRGSKIQVEFHETREFIYFRVISFGPRIEPEEQETIFNIFYRGRSARTQEEEGTGFGLYLAQFIASQLGTRIEVSQSEAPGFKGFYLTSFSIRFHKEH